MGVLPLFLYFLGEGAIILIGLSPYFLELWSLSKIEAPSWTTIVKLKTNVLCCGPPFQFKYIWELNFKQTIWDKSEVLLGMSWGTHWEYIGNKDKTKFPPPSPPPPLKRKKLDLSWVHACLFIGYMKLLFPKPWDIAGTTFLKMCTLCRSKIPCRKAPTNYTTKIHLVLYTPLHKPWVNQHRHFSMHFCHFAFTGMCCHAWVHPPTICSPYPGSRTHMRNRE